LDIDLHHGNGTQGIFYGRGDVLTVSLHADPKVFYPFFWGHAGEQGEGAGKGCNLNLPLAIGTGDEGYMPTLEQGLAAIRRFAPGMLVIALGLDAAENDPLAGLKITTPGFAEIAKRIAGLRLPTVLIQEGGYLTDELGRNLASFLNG
jgi:acetoin utilization deacetylase AcuC-like enzyme